MPLIATRYCLRCKDARPVRKVKEPHWRASKRLCVVCNGPTRRIKGRRKKDVMPAPLYEHKKLEQEADDLWRRIIWAKAVGGRCARCGNVRPLQAAHCFKRKHKQGGLRWEIANGSPICSGCHMHTEGDREANEAFFRSYMGDAEYERLLALKTMGGKVDMKLVILGLKVELAKSVDQTARPVVY